MRIGVPREQSSKERRVAITPAGAATLVADGHDLSVEVGAGLTSGFSDVDYRDAGATVAQRSAVVGTSGVIIQVHGPSEDDLESPEWVGLGTNHALIAQHDPLWRPERAKILAKSGADVLSLELIPRTTKAQSMDVLSSAATVVGYEAALLAATRIQKMLPMMMTAAGTVPPSRIVVLGAGVAGLQAIATARRLGAVVEGYDIRPAATEQIASLGAKPIELAIDAATTEGVGGYAAEQTDELNRRQTELLTPYVAEADAVITTAAIPGAASPELITTAMVEAMAPGSLIIDLAAERGGNCRLTVADDEVLHDGVLILGPTDLASRAAATSSQMFSNNVISLLQHIRSAADQMETEATDRSTGGGLVLNMDDEIIAGTVVSTAGAVVQPQVLDKLSPGSRAGTGGQPS